MRSNPWPAIAVTPRRLRELRCSRHAEGRHRGCRALAVRHGGWGPGHAPCRPGKSVIPARPDAAPPSGLLTLDQLLDSPLGADLLQAGGIVPDPAPDTVPQPPPDTVPAPPPPDIAPPPPPEVAPMPQPPELPETPPEIERPLAP